MQYYFINQDISGGTVKITDKNLLHQMSNVLRFRNGDEIMFLNNKGSKTKAIITNINKNFAEAELKERLTCNPPQKTVRLYMALSKKPATFELIIQKATELGATQIIPLVTSRCQVQNLRNIERHIAIIKEAAEQSERCFLPELKETETLKNVCQNPLPGLLLAGDARIYDQKLKNINLENHKEINLIIGPEGGLTEEEISSIKKTGGTIFSLGNNILRMETAAIAALAVII